MIPDPASRLYARLMSPTLGIDGVGVRLAGGGNKFSPAVLFGSGQQGAWFDPADRPTMFQDSLGITAAAVGQTVGLILDKSRALAIGPELRASGAVGLVGSATAATYNTSTGAGSVTYIDASNMSLVQWTALDATAFYVLTISNTASANLDIRRGDHNGTLITRIAGGATATIYVGGSSASLTFRSQTAATITFSVTSLKKIAGNHAYQATAASRPILACHPLTGRRNTLIYTEDFTNAFWIKQSATLSTSVDITNPDGSANVATVTHNGGGATAYFYGGGSTLPNLAQGAASVWIRRRTGSGVVRLRASSIADTPITISTSWSRVTMPTVGYTSGNSWVLSLDTPGDAVDIWRPQLELGSSATNYQKVVSTYEITEASVLTLYHLVFDGTDDGLVTNAIDLSASDKITVWAGVRKLSDAARASVAELGPGGSNGQFGIEAPQGAASATFMFYVRGTAVGTTDAVASSQTAPITAVLTGSGDIAADVKALRVNGVAATAGTGDLGSGNFGSAYPLYIGRRSGSSLPFNGYLYGLIVRGTTAAANDVAQTERWLNSRTGAY